MRGHPQTSGVQGWKDASRELRAGPLSVHGQVTEQESCHTAVWQVRLASPTRSFRSRHFEAQLELESS